MKYYRLLKDVQFVDGVTVRAGAIVAVKNVNTIPTPKDIFKNREEERCPTCSACGPEYCVCSKPQPKEEPKSQEGEECKHEVSDKGRWAYHCDRCGFDGVFINGVLERPKEKPSEQVMRKTAGRVSSGHFFEDARHHAILDFLDEQFAKEHNQA